MSNQFRRSDSPLALLHWIRGSVGRHSYSGAHQIARSRVATKSLMEVKRAQAPITLSSLGLGLGIWMMCPSENWNWKLHATWTQNKSMGKEPDALAFRTQSGSKQIE